MKVRKINVDDAKYFVISYRGVSGVPSDSFRTALENCILMLALVCSPQE
ncbi:MAG: hypothetical protein ACOC2U_05455 [bacterium]